MITQVSKKTRWLRHRIVKLIAPRLYAAQYSLLDLLAGTPRPMIAVAKVYFNYPLVGAEIGVAEAHNALSILEMLPMKILYLIDPYLNGYVEDGIEKRYGLDAFDIAKEKLTGFSQVKFILKTSDEACKHIHELLDFVYIDGNHSYEYVKRDICNYYPLVKTGGIIGGHDYVKHYSGVIQAANEFAKENNFALYTACPDWWIIK